MAARESIQIALPHVTTSVLLKKSYRVILSAVDGLSLLFWESMGVERYMDRVRVGVIRSRYVYETMPADVYQEGHIASQG
jgi:hypothetical protein